ncbi:MAG: recombination mediator RecR [Myxococcota bacterium]
MPADAVDPFARLVAALGRLPGIGDKSATRLAFFILRQGSEYARELASALVDASDQLHLCPSCMNLTDRERCRICMDGKRDPRLLCVVETVQDLQAIERTREFSGVYHVLHGTLAPLEGVGPDQLKIRELMARLTASDRAVEEVILATNPSVEGEATALYLYRLLGQLGVSVSRIASGLPMGGDFEYADPATISRALQGRTPMS